MHCFVILHYKNLEDTLECIKSIKKIKGEKKILVVDNATLEKESEKKLKKEVDQLILLKENIGFSKANNQGIKVAVEKYNPQYISVINNDTVIEDKNWIEKIKEIDEIEHFDLLGPKIICEEGLGSVNPYHPLKTKEEVEKELNYQKKLLFIYQHKLLRNLLKIYIHLKRKINPQPIPKNGSKKEKNVALHGCAIIFSNKYLKKFPEAFYPNTFLYHEESFLYHRVQKYHLIAIYDPNISIIHKEGQSTKNLPNSEKLIFRTKEVIKSLSLLKEELDRKEEEK